MRQLEMIDDELNFQEVQARIHRQMIELLEDGATPFQIAGVMAASAVTIYKNMLDDSEFQNLMESIIDTAVVEEPEETPTIH